MSHAVKLDETDGFGLPPALLGRSDVSRVLREIERLDYVLEAQTIRAPDQPQAIPSMSRALADCVTLNNITVTNTIERQRLVKLLRHAKEKAPVIHVTFAIDPVPAVTAQIALWIRENLHPQALISVGLQPRIVGGCIVRTPDHIYDFSIRKRFKDSEAVLINRLNQVVAGQK